MPSDIIEFFDQLSDEYDDFIHRVVPRYREMFWAMLYYLPEDFTPANILELGCGTGNLTRLLSERWPQSKITAVDISDEMLQKTAQKLKTQELSLVKSSFETVAFPLQSFDLVISSIAMHHIVDCEKERLIQHIYGWLKPSGFFILGDQVRGTTERLYQADVTFYEHHAGRERGASEEDIINLRDHRNSQDHYATLDNLRQWLKNAGFTNIDILWRYCFWAVIQSQKA